MTKEKRKPSLRRRMIIGAIVGLIMALVVYLLLGGLVFLLQFVLIIGLVVSQPGPLLHPLIISLALIQIPIGLFVAYQTTGEKRSLAKNLRRTYLIMLLVLVLSSPLYICGLLLGPEDLIGS